MDGPVFRMERARPNRRRDGDCYVSYLLSEFEKALGTYAPAAAGTIALRCCGNTRIPTFGLNACLASDAFLALRTIGAAVSTASLVVKPTAGSLETKS